MPWQPNQMGREHGCARAPGSADAALSAARLGMEVAQRGDFATLVRQLQTASQPTMKKFLAIVLAVLALAQLAL